MIFLEARVKFSEQSDFKCQKHKSHWLTNHDTQFSKYAKTIYLIKT